jgi:hypothetical protein
MKADKRMNRAARPLAGKLPAYAGTRSQGDII